MNRVISVLLVLVPAIAAVGAVPWNDEARLVSDLWTNAGYDAKIRPVRNASETVQVALRVDVFSILNVDSKEQEIRIASVFNMKWQDDRLRWKPDVYNGLEYLSVAAGKTWYPKLRVLNALEESRLITDDTEVMITSEGVLHVLHSLIFETQCHLQQALFPFDVQECQFLVGTAGVPSGVMRLEASKADKPREEVQSISSWHLDDLTVRGILSPTCIDAHAVADGEECRRTSETTVNLTLRREPKYHVYTVLAPCTILTLLASMIFWLPTECGEKLSFGISILFGFVIFQLLVQDALSEAGGEKPSLLIRYVLFNFALVGVAVMISAVSIALYHRGDGGETSQGTALCKICAPHAQVGIEDPQQARLTQDREGDAAKDEEKPQSKAKKPWNWKKIAKYLDRVSFVVYYIAFFIFFLVIVVEVIQI
ncbi:acetylcholine receptor subunit beta-like [Patiria miniata]|uniref:Uncharacterized protein n=1 Tax=Patiria miniata TaxID=46514 RepID=A0A914AJI7_PATMI|nr:acetylcholine receptor subunit beta-like [Patiria miniata]XP_038063892.1 acetylcholine receptor subunit beta-like [Patiria miniata]